MHGGSGSLHSGKERFANILAPTKSGCCGERAQAPCELAQGDWHRDCD